MTAKAANSNRYSRQPASRELDVLITDTRLIVASCMFDQGRTGGGLGPAEVVAAGNITDISKARAAQCRRGRTLAGHLEQLAAFSLLACWVDQASVERV